MRDALIKAWDIPFAPYATGITQFLTVSDAIAIAIRLAQRRCPCPAGLVKGQPKRVAC